jgi:Tfp pilus assembly protein PilZ
MGARQYDFIFTSPPYCNRYDYTRTYALELAFLGCDEEKVKNLRQAMMTCTVENKAKAEALRLQYKRFGRSRFFNQVMEAFEQQASLQEVLSFLDDLRDHQELNNPGIARLVRNYFLELNLIVHECSRVLKKGGYFVMVNDNVRYAGEPVPVDLILSELAEHAGLKTRHIWILARGKGNSSQQMGVHGRTELRKCICVWEKS